MNEQIEASVDEYDPTPEELEMMAAKQLLNELYILKHRVNHTMLINPVVIVQVKQILRGFITKYNHIGVFEGEEITMKLKGRGKSAFVDFSYSPHLKSLFAQIEEEILNKMKEEEDNA